LPGNTDKNYGQLQYPDRVETAEFLSSKHERSPLDDKISRSSYGFQCFNL